MSTSFPSLYWFWRLSTQVCFQAFWEGTPNTRNLTPEDCGAAREKINKIEKSSIGRFSKSVGGLKDSAI